MHCLRESPLEAFGYLSGSSKTAEAMDKAQSLKDEFAPPDPAETFRLRREMKERGHKLLAVFRAHRLTNRPTRIDAESLPEPGLAHIVVTLSQEGMPAAKAYRIEPGGARQINLEIE